MNYAWSGKPANNTQSYEGVIVEVGWDHNAWTLVADVARSGRRLIQVPAYTGEPKPGNCIRLIGRQPLLGIVIEGVDVFAQGHDREVIIGSRRDHPN